MATAVMMLNRRSNSRTGETPYEKLYRKTAETPTLAFMKEMINGKEVKDDKRPKFEYNDGETVLYRHPHNKMAKTEIEWKEYIVVR